VQSVKVPFFVFFTFWEIILGKWKRHELS
jgi:hypothetical protein